MNGHNDLGFSLLFEPDALREEERRQYYDLDEPRYPANDGADEIRCSHLTTWPLAGGQLLRCYRCGATIKREGA